MIENTTVASVFSPDDLTAFADAFNGTQEITIDREELMNLRRACMHTIKRCEEIKTQLDRILHIND